MPLVSFGDFSFTQTHMVQQKFTTNFGEQLVRTTKYPGISGGLDEYGTAPGPTEIGAVWFSFTMVSYTRSQMEEFRDEVKRLGDLGVRRLTFTPEGTDLPDRWCYARLNHLRMEQRLDEHTDLFQPVELIFQVIWPFWETAGNRLFWDDTTSWDDAEVWGGSPELTTGVGTTTFVVTNHGSATTFPVITIIPQAGQTIENLEIQKTNNTLEILNFPSIIGSDEVLVINCLTASVTLDGDPYYGVDQFVPTSPFWLRLTPGANILKFSSDNDGIADVYLRYAEYWR